MRRHRDGVPAGADAKPTVDVDGDGQADTEWIATQIGADGAVTFGVTTASGATFTSQLRSASPVARSVLVADVTGHGELIAVAGDGRQVLLYGISDCQLVPEQDQQGQQYAFDLGFTGFGTGVGCADVDGDSVADLVGLRAEDTTITSTVVRLDGPRATNGTSRTTEGATAAQVGAASQVSCGDRRWPPTGSPPGPERRAGDTRGVGPARLGLGCQRQRHDHHRPRASTQSRRTRGARAERPPP